MVDNELNRCRVCGLFLKDLKPWGESGTEPTFDMCPCCGVEFGYGDRSPESARMTRERWLGGGARWDKKQKQPPNWDAKKQLEGVPEKFR